MSTEMMLASVASSLGFLLDCLPGDDNAPNATYVTHTRARTHTTPNQSSSTNLMPHPVKSLRLHLTNLKLGLLMVCSPTKRGRGRHPEQDFGRS